MDVLGKRFSEKYKHIIVFSILETHFLLILVE